MSDAINITAFTSAAAVLLSNNQNPHGDSCSSIGRTPGVDSSNTAEYYLPRAWHAVKVIVLSRKINFLLVLVPLGIVAGKFNCSATIVFAANLLGIIPLAAVLSLEAKQCSKKLGNRLAEPLITSLSNAELIVGIVALRVTQIEVAQSAMFGSAISSMLLMLGMCFFFGGIVNSRDRVTGQGMEQTFNTQAAHTTCSLMSLSLASLVISAALNFALDKSELSEKEHAILVLSRGTAVVLLMLYVLYLWFRFHTHYCRFHPESQQQYGEEDTGETEEPIMTTIPISFSLFILVITAFLVAICAGHLVGSIDGFSKSANVNKRFVGLILLPTANASKHLSAVHFARRNKMDRATDIAAGSSIQIALLFTPLLVILGWSVFDQPMTLRFGILETVAVLLSTLVATFTLQDGKSNYFEGALLIGLYLIIALLFYVSPGDLRPGFI